MSVLCYNIIIAAFILLCAGFKHLVRDQQIQYNVMYTSVALQVYEYIDRSQAGWLVHFQLCVLCFIIHTFYHEHYYVLVQVRSNRKVVVDRFDYMYDSSACWY